MSSALAVLRRRDFRLFILARFLSSVAVQMLVVAVGWQVYDLTHDPLDLGYVGLVQFLPAFLLGLPAGQVADRYDRRLVLAAAMSFEALTALALCLASLGTAPPVGAIFALLVGFGAARAFLAPAGQSLVPLLVSAEEFPRAVAWSSSSWQVAVISGPAVGGLLYIFGPAVVYAVTTTLLTLAALLVVRLKARLVIGGDESRGLESMLAGVRYVWNRKIILGAVSLDLFAVLLGGATALLPIYARDILHVGPAGLGLLRSAPAVGAAVMAVALAHWPLRRRAGHVMFACVALFGFATIVFGLSESVLLSFAVLIVMGAADMVSVVVRQTLVQIATPDSMRGRVSAVNHLFIGASNELGEFESGMAAAWFGTVPAVVLGGIGTILVVGLWARLFPQLRRVDRLDAAPP